MSHPIPETSTAVMPTIGRIVWYRPAPLHETVARNRDEEQPIAAIITLVRSRTRVDLELFGGRIDGDFATDVLLLADESSPPSLGAGYAEWPPKPAAMPAFGEFGAGAGRAPDARAFTAPPSVHDARAREPITPTVGYTPFSSDSSNAVVASPESLPKIARDLDGLARGILDRVDAIVAEVGGAEPSSLRMRMEDILQTLRTASLSLAEAKLHLLDRRGPKG